MSRCVCCRRQVPFYSGYRDDAGRYCSIHCYASNPTLSFCPECQSTTTGEPVGDTITINGIGTIFADAKGRCNQCHSVVQGKYGAVLYVPVAPMGLYRVLYQPRPRMTSPIRFVAQPLTSEAAVTAATVPSERGALTPIRRYALLAVALLVSATGLRIATREVRSSMHREALQACAGHAQCEAAVNEHFNSCFGVVSPSPFSTDRIDKAALAECINTKAGFRVLTATPRK